MKKMLGKIFLIVCCIFLMSGCKSNLERVNYDEVMSMINQGNTFILEITQDNCSHCQEFSPRFKSVLKDNNVTAYNLNITYISEDDYNKFNDKYNFNGTPTVMFFKDGKEVLSSRISGAVGSKNITQALKKQGYIK